MKAMQKLRAGWKHWEPILFPKCEIYARQVPPWAQIVFVLVFAALGVGLARLMPAGGLIGFDWIVYFSHGKVEPLYPPWGSWIVARLTWESLVGLSLAGVSLAVMKRAVHPVSAVCALLALPMLWTIFLGQLEGLVTLGLSALPWLVMLALLKPQLSTFAFGARPIYLAAFFVWVAISLVIWGWWPGRMLAFESYYGEGRLVTDISLHGFGLPLALLMFWVSRGDMDLLMLSGAFATLYLLPYNLLPVVPAIARLRPRSALLATLLSWLPFSANWLGQRGWWLGWAFIGFLWLCLVAARYPHVAPKACWRRVFIQTARESSPG
jgi:hypothetical protein